MQAFENAYLFVFRDGDANNIPGADEGTVYQIDYFDGEETDEDKQYNDY